METFSAPTPSDDSSRAAREREVNAVMAKQAGLVSFNQLIEIGFDRKAVARRVANGRLTVRTATSRPVRRRTDRPARRSPATNRVFGAHPGPLSIDARRWMGVLACPGVGLIDHISTCALFGLEDQRSGPIHVVRKGERWNAPRGVIAHRTAVLPARDVTRHRGIPSVTVARALIDAAADVSANRLDDLLDNAVRRELYDGAAVIQVLEDRPTFRGARRLESAMGRLDSTSGTFRSNFERRTKRLIDRSTVIPSPVVNVLLEGFEPDLLFPGTRAIVECDGRDYHRSPKQIARDELREELLRSLGYVFLYLRWHHVKYEEERTLARVERFVLANLEPPVPC